MIVADYIVRFIAAQGVTHVFELSGGMITPLLDAIARLEDSRDPSLRLVDMRHEQAAGFAAEGWARMTGIPGVALATSGPGATNLLTAIASCYFDSTPAVFITGNVSTKDREQGGGRQRGFQETDIVAMAKPVTKRAWACDRPEGIVEAIDRAFRVASSGRRGPVLLDIPFDVLRSEIPSGALCTIGPPWTPHAIDPAWLDETIATLRRASRPLVLVGGGIRSAGVVEVAREAIKKLGVPVVHSLQGLDVLGSNHPLNAGMIGSYGNRWANWALAASDALLVLGSRLDIRQTGSDVTAFAGPKRIIRVDIDRSEERVHVDRLYPVDLDVFLRSLAARDDAMINPGPWLQEIRASRDAWPDVAESNAPEGTINPNLLMHAIGASFPDAAAFVLDVGAHQMWAAQSLRFFPDQRVLSSGGLGAMGFALPAAIGACFASGGREVVVITGDSSLQVNIQELETIAALDLPIKIIVLDNQGHGMVRQFQREVFDGRTISTSPISPQFTEIARAYGIRSNIMTDVNRSMLEGMSGAGRGGWADHPKLLVVPISPLTSVYPKLAYGRYLDDMEGKPSSSPEGKS